MERREINISFPAVLKDNIQYLITKQIDLCILQFAFFGLLKVGVLHFDVESNLHGDSLRFEQLNRLQDTQTTTVRIPLRLPPA